MRVEEWFLPPIFEIKEDFDLNATVQKLKGFRREEPYRGKKGETKLVTEISDLRLEESSIPGIFSKGTLDEFINYILEDLLTLIE